MALRRQGGGHGPQVRDVVGVEWPGPPGVVTGRGQAGQQAAARGEPQGVQGRRAPAGGGRVGGPVVPGAHQVGQRLGERQRQRGRGPAPHAGAVPPHDGQLRRPAGPLAVPVPAPVPGGRSPEVLCCVYRPAVGIPEGDPSLAREWCGQEDGREPDGDGRRRRPGPPCLRHGHVAHTFCHLPPVHPIRCLRLYGRGLTIGSDGLQPVPGTGRDATGRGRGGGGRRQRRGHGPTERCARPRTPSGSRDCPCSRRRPGSAPDSPAR